MNMWRWLKCKLGFHDGVIKNGMYRCLYCGYFDLFSPKSIDEAISGFPDDDRGLPMLINMMKCRKCKRWFHGGMTGWVCPYCNP